MEKKLDEVVLELRRMLQSSVDDANEESRSDARFELFHADDSVCSYKVRAVLAHHGAKYDSRLMSFAEGETYLAPYVRLRSMACAELGIDLVGEHLGTTSVAAAGCDPAVVPTLVDWEDRNVIIDSMRICLYLEERLAGAGTLIPKSHSDEVLDEMRRVDNLPNSQLVGGEGGAERSMRKVARCDEKIQAAAGDEELVKAYSAKRLKEASAAQKLYSPDALRKALVDTEKALDHLEEKLSDGRQWVVGGQLTLADIFWGVQLLHMERIAYSYMWEDGKRPAVARYLEEIEKTSPLSQAFAVHA